MKNDSTSTTGKIYFTTNAQTSFTEAKSATFTLNANDSGYTEYVVNMSANSLWTGTLKRVRVHPGTGVTSGSFSIDYISVDEINPTIAWEYPNNTEGWAAYNHIGGFSWQSGGYIGGNITGTDPYIISADNLGASISSAKIIKIRLKNNTSSTTGQVYYTTDANPNFTETKSKTFSIIPNDSNHTEYTINMSDKTTWTGTLKQFRIDPSSDVSSGSFSIDYIRIIE